MAETLTDGADKERDTDQEYLENMEKTSLYSFFATRYYGSYHPEVRLGAMGPAGSLGGNLSFGGEDDGMVFYTAALNVSNTRDGFRYQNGQVRAPRFTSGSGGDYGSSSLMYGTEPMVAEYFLGNGTEVETLSFLPASEEFFANPQYAYLKRFSGQAYFYNLATESYDPVNLEQVDFSESDLLPYLSPEGSLKVKYVGGESAEAGISQVLPLLMVTGRER